MRRRLARTRDLALQRERQAIEAQLGVFALHWSTAVALLERGGAERDVMRAAGQAMKTVSLFRRGKT